MCLSLQNYYRLFPDMTFKAVVIRDRSPHAPHHYLILSKLHINQASDLTAVDLPLGEVFLNFL